MVKWKANITEFISIINHNPSLPSNKIGPFSACKRNYKKIFRERNLETKCSCEISLRKL